LLKLNRPWLVPLCLGLALAGCKGETPPAAAAQPEVRVVSAVAQSVPLTREWVGRVESFRQVEVRPQVEGTLWKRFFTEGRDVKKGERLYQIDPRPFQAQLAEAQANLAAARAKHLKAQQKLARVLPLVKDEALSEQDGDNAIAEEKETAAAVAQAVAAVTLAKVSLGYTDINATQAGRIARTLVQEGALVRPNSQLTVIDQIDPVYVTFNVTDKEQLAFRKAKESGKVTALAPNVMQVRVKLPDDTLYPATGTLDFGGVIVNKETGTFTARAVFPNAEHVLLPGMFVRVEVELGAQPNAVLVPQQAVVKAVNDHFVYVVNSKDQVERRTVVVGGWHESQWVIDKGLAAGERVIVGDLQKVSTGLTVKPVADTGSSGTGQPPASAPAPKTPGA
jgi:membrane fusion protein (multidrug efflux system)